MPPTLASGTKLGRYEIRSKIGQGGMGEVYLAFDTELDRTVAIKILPEALAFQHQRLQRFIQEAKAASALNHPHILTIHEIGITGTSRFIVTEFIDGETLRHEISSGRKVTELLEIAIQAGSALAAAHAAGIVHRDIKPENIMVRRDGYIKLLDFGLAKLTETEGSVTDGDAQTMLVNTRAGVLVGTPNYMSPEQAKGTRVDARTDLWSLGVVLYEMVTAHLPFAGETPSETISLILQKEPAPLSRYAHEVPAELERIVRKALTKNREERYQSAKDLLIDLRNLKRKLAVDAEIDRTVSPEFRAATSTGGEQGPTTRSGGTVATAEAGAKTNATSAEYIVSGIKRHKLATAVAVIVLAAGVLGLSFYLRGRQTEAAIESIAVLPFENQNHDPDSEYLSDGITESIINSLTQLPNLKVIARSSVFRYKGNQTDPLVAGKELGVRAILTGRVIQRGDNLIISAELVDVRENKQLWGEHYSRRTTDILQVQEDIAKEITNKLRLQLTGEERQLIARRYTDNTDAYELYLKGRYFFSKGNEEGLNQSLVYYQQAIAADPHYALAYVGLANTYATLGSVLGFRSPQETSPESKAFLTRALELDPKLAEAHYALANYKLNYEWGWAEAEKEFRRAIELNPNYAQAHQGYGTYFQVMGKLDQAMEERKLAQKLDPISPFAIANTGYPYYYARQYDEAIAHYRKALELDPNFSWGHLWIGQAYVQKGMYKEAIDEINQAIHLSNGDTRARATLGHAYAVAGKRDEALKVLAELVKDSERRYVSPYFIALIYLGLRDDDQAFAWLQKAYEERQPYLILMKVEPIFNEVRADPRFADLVRRVGIP